MHASSTALVIAIVALSVGCSQPVSPTRPTSNPLDDAGARAEVVGGRAGAAQRVPFKGRLEASSTVTFDPPPSPFFSVFLEGSGNATLLGRFTLEAPHRVDTRTGTGVGSFRFRAADGNMLTADFSGAGSPTGTPGVFSIVETATITGGTGRFAGASGNFIVERTINLASPYTAGPFEGIISWHNGGKP